MVSRRTVRAIAALLGLTLLAGLGYALRWRSNPSPCPYAQRHAIDLLRPVITRSRLRDVLEPQPGERILEVGPGTGYYTGMVARAIEPSGTLHAVDVQSEMVEHLRTRMQQEGTLNVEPIRGDARSLPYPDNTFDAAYLVLVLGEIPDQERALDELERVLKPDGRLVVGESLPDPHFVRFEGLRHRIEQRGLAFDARVGTRVGYFARFDAGVSERSDDSVE
ncbi:Methyltransferase type 11 (plasmid) [Haloterrigena turkmenica DSM 5511]|uniref:Methyltransferase type 11 n=1 Tax=Haloterrigena turkmenica (strain ATCC 51198 / DSM 5511 / JCM 9101 / NCIMB 13204 / VKM B-1734 / 4k) TaxID=543526 RepID=D2S0Z4_HALTV|nr:methyltransferase domain-containing protein [Haloterrigena turkmenica]ADB63041.1 Methyltransferase type 11 [Haloterrigena turkmenica DSM 5511]